MSPKGLVDAAPAAGEPIPFLASGALPVRESVKSLFNVKKNKQMKETYLRLANFFFRKIAPKA